MPASERRYCAVGIHWANTPDTIQFLAMSIADKAPRMVLFETVEQARSVLPRLGGGRLSCWDAERETVYFTPISPQGFNRLCIVTGYDPYDVLGGQRRNGIYSEAEGRDWRCHVVYFEVINELLAWSDSLEAQRLNAIEGEFAEVNL